ncbi:MAG: glycine--tRNA ligase [Candidatus Dojkabacteria bacterium]
MSKNEELDKIVNLAKRRGFIYPSSEIYGGLANTYDFGPYGVALKRNLQQSWWKRFISGREDIFPIDSSIIMNPMVWEASGHVESFSDVMVEDKKNQQRHRADHLIEDYFAEKGEEVKVDGKTAEELQRIIEKEGIKSPSGNELSEAKQFNNLFETEIGIISGDKNKAYLRGEIAQGLFINYKNIIDSFSPKLPFGIGQSGKAFRNEITAGKFTFRTLEFDLMEFEYFFDAETNSWEELFEYWKEEVHQFALSIGLNQSKLRWRPHEEFELSHYSSRTEDLEYEFPWGYKEVFAVAYRTDFDLKNHMEKSGKNLQYITEDGRKIIPHVVEPTFGLSRLVTVILMDAYQEQELEDGRYRTLLKLNKQIAPVQAAVFALQKDDGLVKLSHKIYEDLLSATSISLEHHNSGNIGKMYRKQDEIGTPYCVTVDYDSLKDESVTIRDRDTMAQERIKIKDLQKYLEDKLV